MAARLLRDELLAPGGRVRGYCIENNDQTLKPVGSLHSYGNSLIDLLKDGRRD